MTNEEILNEKRNQFKKELENQKLVYLEYIENFIEYSSSFEYDDEPLVVKKLLEHVNDTLNLKLHNIDKMLERMEKLNLTKQSDITLLEIDISFFNSACKENEEFKQAIDLLKESFAGYTKKAD